MCVCPSCNLHSNTHTHTYFMCTISITIFVLFVRIIIMASSFKIYFHITEDTKKKKHFNLYFCLQILSHYNIFNCPLHRSNIEDVITCIAIAIEKCLLHRVSNTKCRTLNLCLSS